jgi:Asp/Glu/hydantoin racemase
MNILLINPNTSEHVTQRLLTQAKLVVGEQAIIHAYTAQTGPAIISSRSENAIALAEMLRLAATHQNGHDVVVLGVSIDTGLMALREMLNIPVVGMAEAALVTASMLPHHATPRHATPRHELWPSSCGLLRAAAGPAVAHRARAAAAGAGAGAGGDRS